MDKLILEAIQEELGIADTVVETTNRVVSLVEENIKTQDRRKITNGVETNTFRLSTNFKFEPVVFEIKNMFFSDVNAYFAYRKKYKPSPNRYVADTNTIKIEVDYVNGWHDRERFEGAIQHELEHLFQDHNAGFKKEKSSQYRLASANYNNKQSTIQLVSKMIYFSEDREIYAFYNQAYQALMDNSNDFDCRKAITETNLFKAYTTLKKGLKFLDVNVNNAEIDNLLLKFGTNSNKLRKRVDLAIKEYARYIGRAIVKVEKDKLNRSIENGDDVIF